MAGARGHVLGPRHHVVFPGEPPLFVALLQHEWLTVGRDADERHSLGVGAVRVAGTKTHLLELIDEVRDSQVFAVGSRGPALVLVR